MSADVFNRIEERRGGLIELALWIALYCAVAIPMALGTTNGIGYFQQPKGVSLWAPLFLGGAVNFGILYLHAFRAMPCLLTRGGRAAYGKYLAFLLSLYLAAHLSYQLVIARAFEPALRDISPIDWTLENLQGAPFVFVFSALYKVARDWGRHAGERETLLQRTSALESELRLMKNEVQDLQKGLNGNAVLRFQSSRENIQTPVSAIFYIKSAGNYVEIVTASKTYTVYGTMGELLNALPQDRFARIHRSYIVNLDHIETMDRREASIGDAALPIGGSYRQSLMEKWTQKTAPHGS